MSAGTPDLAVALVILVVCMITALDFARMRCIGNTCAYAATANGSKTVAFPLRSATRPLAAEAFVSIIGCKLARLDLWTIAVVVA